MTAAEFKQQFLPHTRSMMRVAWRLTRNKAEAEDLVQETFLRLWQKREQLAQIDCPPAFLATLVRNTFVSLKRSEKLQTLQLSEEMDAVEESATPTQLLETAQTQQIYDEALAQLPEVQRQVIVLRDVCQLSYEEIAAQTGLQQGNLRVQLSRARKTVREKLRNALKH